MKNYFCEQCAGKPGWPFDAEKVFQHACQRCFQYKPCNDYDWKLKPSKVDAAPAPKDFIVDSKEHVDIKLPQAKMAATEIDQALDTIYPNRPGIKLETKSSGRKASAAATPKFEE